MKTEVIPFREFMNGDYKKSVDQTTKILTATLPALVLITPKLAFAATADATFGNVHKAIMNAFDAGVVLVIIFAGASWGFGHRTKAIEILIGVSCGYILARHAVDIRNFLQGI
ncbi:hypothetical protein [Priestia flexa]|uniref:Glycosyltransferase n=1 Tax=Priestia flexa TaxID=86664 RepID=A0ABU4J2D1_9BACI|nr:hypothetical protein [Priestia flexa]MDW8515145.1 glycosyltransferase [Priestia flexa]MEC0667057.1 glycosyltransferase [Priestia flexa]